MNAPRVVTWANCSPAPVGPVHAIPDIIAALEANVEARTIAKGQWVIGYGYDARSLAEKRDLTRRDLDAHFPDNPVMVIHVSNHGAMLKKERRCLLARAAPAGGPGLLLSDPVPPAPFFMEASDDRRGASTRAVFPGRAILGAAMTLAPSISG